MRRHPWIRVFLVLALLALLVPGAPVFSQDPTPPGLQRLDAATPGGLEVTWDAAGRLPTFLRGAMPAPSGTPKAAALAFIQAYPDVFGTPELAGAEVYTDDQGMTHVKLRQFYQGVPVYAADLSLHLSADGQRVVAVQNGLVMGLALPDVTPALSASQAVILAASLMPGGTLSAAPALVVYAGVGPRTPPRLAWQLALHDGGHDSAVFFLDADSGHLLDRLERFQNALDRHIYDGNNTTDLPGDLVRGEGQEAVDDEDANLAYDFTGAAYHYFTSTFGRDSYDGQGAGLTSTVHYGTAYQNAGWDGNRSQMVYGDGFVVRDVTGHELTHAVVQYTAGLEYHWQSGALNESLADIFGAMIDREDWLMGEDLPADFLAGRGALRDLADPARLGQPAHVDDWVETCSDAEGVHANSGITNKAAFNIAEAIGREATEQIFYLAMTTYLGATSSLEDMRAGALQAATDRHGADSDQYRAVEAGFNAVGLDGQWQPPTNNCSCAATTALENLGAAKALEVAGTLYQVRAQFLPASAVGQHYAALYAEHTGQLSKLLLADGQLRTDGASLLAQVTPGLKTLITGNGEVVINVGDVTAVQAYLLRLAAADGGGELSGVIEREMARIDWGQLVGLTYGEAWKYLSSLGFQTLFLPIVVH